MTKRGRRANSKQGECCSCDQISQLPDELLVSILSLLNLKQAAATSVLSSRWRYLSTFTSRLIFDRTDVVLMLDAADYERKVGPDYRKERLKFIRWVNRVLAFHKSFNIEEFKVCFSLDEGCKASIDKWLKFALSRKVRRLELNCSGEWGTWSRYNFPCTLLAASKVISSSNVKPPNLRGMNRCTSFEIKQLQSLSLNYVNVDGETLEHFLVNCPVLELLSVTKSKTLVHLKVCGPLLALKFLEIRFCSKIRSIVIRDTSIVSLKYEGKKIDFLLENSPLLVDVYIGRNFTSSMADVFLLLKDCLPQLEVFTIWKDKFEEIEMLHPFKRLKNLKQLAVKIDSCDDSDNYLPLIHILNASPCLQKLVLKVEWVDSMIVSKNIRRVAGTPYSGLEEFEFIGYYGRTNDLEFVMHLLENAVALKRIVVDPHDREAPHLPRDANEIEEEEAATNRARMQLQKIMPPGIQLVILDQ